MRFWKLALIGISASFTAVCAQEAAPPPAPPATRPAAVAAEPASPEVQKLIDQLADPDPDVRDKAGKRLLAIGKPALDSLKQAAASTDPELRARAKPLVRRIEQKPVPQPGNGPMRHQAVRVSVNGQTKTINVNDNGQEVRIEEGPDGIEMTVSGLIDGQPATETYRAKTADELKQDNPDAFSLYDKWAARGNGGVVMIGPGQVFIGPQIGPVPPGGLLIPPQVDPLENFRDQLTDAMTKAGIGKDQQKQLMDLLRTIEKLQAPPVDDEARDKQLKELFKESDELREQLNKLKLPDPGNLLPPPAKARLGVQLTATGDDLVVSRVVSGSRAEKLGVKTGDIIEKVNGHRLIGVDDLRRTVAAAKEPLTVQVRRDGEAVILKEKE